MSWWGGVLGGTLGFMLGGPLGALLGVALGRYVQVDLPGAARQFDVGGREQVQAAFFTATFSVMGHVAKADGVVVRDEIDFGEQVMRRMQLNADQRRAAIELYRQGKKTDFRLRDVLEQFRYVCRRGDDLLRVFMEIQVQAALADGRMHPAQERVLLQVCDILGFPRHAFDALLAMAGAARSSQYSASSGPSGPTLDDAYALLGVDPDADERAVKQAYRRMLSRHHPDKLVSKGLPDEMIQLANEKTHEIRRAYERIRQARGL